MGHVTCTTELRAIKMRYCFSRQYQYSLRAINDSHISNDTATSTTVVSLWVGNILAYACGNAFSRLFTAPWIMSVVLADGFGPRIVQAVPKQSYASSWCRGEILVQTNKSRLRHDTCSRQRETLRFRPLESADKGEKRYGYSDNGKFILQWSFSPVGLIMIDGQGM